MKKETKAVLGAIFFVVLMAVLQVPIIIVRAAQANGCTKYVSWIEAQQKIVFELYFNAFVIVLTGSLIVGFLRMYRISFKEFYVRFLVCGLTLWALLTTMESQWSISDCGAAHDPEHVVYFSWIGPYLAQPVILLKVAVILGTAYRIFRTRFRSEA